MPKRNHRTLWHSFQIVLKWLRMHILQIRIHSAKEHELLLYIIRRCKKLKGEPLFGLLPRKSPPKQISCPHGRAEIPRDGQIAKWLHRITVGHSKAVSSTRLSHVCFCLSTSLGHIHDFRGAEVSKVIVESVTGDNVGNCASKASSSSQQAKDQGRKANGEDKGRGFSVFHPW